MSSILTSQCSLHVTRGMEPCWCWRQLSLVTDRMGSSTPQLHTPLGVQRWPPQTSSSPGHRWVLSLTGDAGTIRDLTDPGQSTKKVQSAWMKVIRAVEERQNQSLHNLYYIVIYSEEVCKMLWQYWYSSSCYLDEDIFSLYVGSDVCRTLHYSIFTGDCCQL